MDQIVAKLREAEKHQAQGATIAQVRKRLQIEPDLLPLAAQVRATWAKDLAGAGRRPRWPGFWALGSGGQKNGQTAQSAISQR